MRALDETGRRGSGRADLHKALQETGGLVISYSQKAFARMADIDRRLRGNGFPQSVELRDTSREQKGMEALVERLVDARVRQIPLPKRWWQDEMILKWAALATAFLSALVTVAVKLAG